MKNKRADIGVILFVMCIVLLIFLLGGVIISAKSPQRALSRAKTVQIVDSIPTVALVPVDTQTLSVLQTEAEIPSINTPAPQLSAAEYFRASTSLADYSSWIKKISGAEAVSVGGTERKIETRYSYAMFGGQPNALATEYLLETLQAMLGADKVVLEPYTYVDGGGQYTWNNIVVTFPGFLYPNEQVLIGAHYDSVVVFEGDPLVYAPGANDNGTGVAALLEAARIFRTMTFERSVKLIFFSGEENFMEGSKAYATAHADEKIIGLINLDMFGTDADNDRCFEMHVGDLPGSKAIGETMKRVIHEQNLNLIYDYFEYRAYEKSDSTPFWMKNIPAVTLMENFVSDTTPGGCGVQDATQNWHLPTDIIENVNLPYAYDIYLAGVLTALDLAGAHRD